MNFNHNLLEKINNNKHESINNHNLKVNTGCDKYKSTTVTWS